MRHFLACLMVISIAPSHLRMVAGDFQLRGITAYYRHVYDMIFQQMRTIELQKSAVPPQQPFTAEDFKQDVADESNAGCKPNRSNRKQNDRKARNKRTGGSQRNEKPSDPVEEDDPAANFPPPANAMLLDTTVDA